MASSWANLPAAVGGEPAISKLSSSFANDSQYLAFTATGAIDKPVTFGVKAAGNDETILITAGNGKGSAKIGKADEALFTLSAKPEQWEQHFQKVPKSPYQSFWGMFGMNIKQEGVEVLGDQTAFATYSHVWRRSLELLHEAVNGPAQLDEDPADENDDHIIGRYLYIDVPVWGKVKIFVESSGTGRQQILFLHTAGSDSRQYHGVMNDKSMRVKCTMFAFDLPGHGRSFPSSKYQPGAYTNTEEAYVAAVAAVIQRLGLRRPIVCGTGQACLAVAVKNNEVGAGGVIPLQGADYLTMERSANDRSSLVNQSLHAPESVYGLIAPNAPAKNKALLWHLYSAQAYGIFHGDLDFYFGGFDGRDRIQNINSAKCPVYMLTGEYDWSVTPEMSKATAEKIPGAQIKTMEGLGHFPATENPKKFVPYLLEAITWITNHRKNSIDRSVMRMTDD